jgi:hypothetical protein
MISHVSWPLELLGCRYISLEIAPLQEANHPITGSLQEFDRTKVSEVAPVAMLDGETGRHQFDNPYLSKFRLFLSVRDIPYYGPLEKERRLERDVMVWVDNCNRRLPDRLHA